MDIYAFTGLTYADDAGRRAAPPYDQIDDRQAEAFHALDDHHFTWLTKPLPGEAGDAYQEAARLHGAWLEEGVVSRDDAPALYPYEILLAGGGRRLGVTALVALEAPDSGVIRPHEDTLAKPLADRVALLEAMEVDLEPVLFLSEDRGRLDELLEEDLADAEPFAETEDTDGHRHRLYRIDDGERIALYRAALSVPAAIADGHHRYKTARRFAEEHGLLDATGRAAEGTAAATKMAVITSLDSPALTIDPIHRAIVHDDVEPAAGVATERRSVDVSSGAEMARAVAEAAEATDAPVLGVQRRGGATEVWILDPEAGAASDTLSEAARSLPVALLHGSVLPALGLDAAAATDGTVRYRSLPDDLWDLVENGEARLGFYLPPMDPKAFAAAIAGGDMLPPKSTRFLPKVVSGLVWADHEADLG